jgi:ParB-like chromosome segregation protein Spo0J
MQVEYLPVRALRPHSKNAKKHPRKQLEKLAQSIKAFGFNNPVLINDENQIIAGHGRVEAAKLLGMETVPTCKISHLSEAETRAYILADNKLGELGGWDHEQLAIELKELIELDVDIAVTGSRQPRSIWVSKRPAAQRAKKANRKQHHHRPPE